ncbi:hypothetical protein AMAG_10403 [Allomyces macrogynus ATCC 38327]|uniref:Uncharacterized protein n=1 Tax=Allomyces macrogynus (strain ATCC 38327) TaxID=578462 RepID=A0A0L0SUZ2_ALLM3|nr:hypothetical protein AMAG_10403 [Allomyces macrogynus ATCC 38327]|eukprot:KNE66154.1 hypothetical protein AMAG_10403 [Allomyces macrogynus ATCC 38327]
MAQVLRHLHMCALDAPVAAAVRGRGVGPLPNPAASRPPTAPNSRPMSALVDAIPIPKMGFSTPEEWEDDLGLGFYMIGEPALPCVGPDHGNHLGALDNDDDEHDDDEHGDHTSIMSTTSSIMAFDDPELQSQYRDVFLAHFLNGDHQEHDDMLFYVRKDSEHNYDLELHHHLSGDPPIPSSEAVDVPLAAHPFRLAVTSLPGPDRLIVQRNTGPNRTLPADLPDVDWVLTVWLNILMQLSYTADVSIDLSSSARILRSYPVYANPYKIDTATHAVTCSFPYMYFTLDENHGTLTQDTKMFMALVAKMEPWTRAPAAAPDAAARLLVEVTVTHSKCLDYLDRQRRKSRRAREARLRSAPQAAAESSWTGTWSPTPSSSRRGSGAAPDGFALGSLLSSLTESLRSGWRVPAPKEYTVGCANGVSQIALTQHRSVGVIEYTIQHVKIHMLDVIARLLL